jgi:hypothetical protein
MSKKGIIYVMTTSVKGIIKIGKTELKNFENRMRHLESNGYFNVSGLHRFFAIEVNDYDKKEKLLHELFSKQKIGESELFAIDRNLIKQLLLSFDGIVIYPKDVNQEKEFEKVTNNKRTQSERFSFYKKGIKNGEIIVFSEDKKIKAKVVGDREVEYNGKNWKLSPLTREIFTIKGKVNKSGSYQGPKFWEYNGKILTDIPDKK